MFFNVFWFCLGVAFLKNNLVDGNGPLAGCFGEMLPTAKGSHILVTSESEAQMVQAKLRELGSDATKEDFAKLAKEWSSCRTAAEGGEIGSVVKGNMEEVFDSTFF